MRCNETTHTAHTDRIIARRLRAIVEAAPAWVSEEILSASERIGDDRAVL